MLGIHTKQMFSRLRELIIFLAGVFYKYLGAKKPLLKNILALICDIAFQNYDIKMFPTLQDFLTSADV